MLSTVRGPPSVLSPPLSPPLMLGPSLAAIPSAIASAIAAAIGAAEDGHDEEHEAKEGGTAGVGDAGESVSVHIWRAILVRIGTKLRPH
jgi:hypothetical protein